MKKKGIDPNRLDERCKNCEYFQKICPGMEYSNLGCLSIKEKVKK